MGKACSKNKNQVKETKDAEVEAREKQEREEAERKRKEAAEAKRQADAEAKRLAEEKARLEAEEAEAARLKAEEEERLRAEAEAAAAAAEAGEPEPLSEPKVETPQEGPAAEFEDGDEEAGEAELDEGGGERRRQPKETFSVGDYKAPEICDPCTLDEEALHELETAPSSPRRSPLGEPVARYAAKMGCDLGDAHDPRRCPICYLLDLSDQPLLN